jgi:hypothetical protein
MLFLFLILLIFLPLITDASGTLMKIKRKRPKRVSQMEK